MSRFRPGRMRPLVETRVIVELDRAVLLPRTIQGFSASYSVVAYPYSRIRTYVRTSVKPLSGYPIGGAVNGSSGLLAGSRISGV